ncbi:MAG: NAD(P)/FAD-dependent oxidoreductase [Coxiellaceae bacterium]|jgi:glycerol-3-phosphate dehydrogenase|nr:NAD(P)/FAD-dependent oxidoreductase [Coxiellaceae bacterium]
MYDISIIGAGIIGCAIARELTKYKLKICLIEKNEDVGAGTTKANSGIVHGGYSDKPGTLKAKLCVTGNAMYQKLNTELQFGFTQTGSFVIGFNERDIKKIEELFTYGQLNGVPNLQIVDGNFVKNKEPNLNEDIIAALYCPTAGITSPYEFAIALAENAIQNGLELKLNTQITIIQKLKDHFLLTTNQEKIATKIVINAAGLYSDEVAQMLDLNEFTITPREGQYLLFDKDEGRLINGVIFQVPSEISKGVLVTKTQHGNLLIGPDATEVPMKDYLDTSKQNIDAIIATAKKTLPDFDLRKVISCFAGNRAASSLHDFIISESNVKGFINAASIESPGLTAAPAIAEMVVEIIANSEQIKLTPNKDFNPYLEHRQTIANMEEEKLNKLINKDPDYGQIVCRCETVSLGEIRTSLHKNIPVNSLDAIRRRTRAGMGRCQGGFCTPKIIQIISEELKIPKENITKKGGESLLVMGKTK